MTHLVRIKTLLCHTIWHISDNLTLFFHQQWVSLSLWPTFSQIEKRKMAASFFSLWLIFLDYGGLRGLVLFKGFLTGMSCVEIFCHDILCSKFYIFYINVELFF